MTNGNHFAQYFPSFNILRNLAQVEVEYRKMSVGMKTNKYLNRKLIGIEVQLI